MVSRHFFFSFEHTNFGANVAAHDIGHELASLQVTKLDEEPVETLVLAMDDGLCNDDRMRRRVAGHADPPLGRCDGRRIEHPLVRIHVIRCCCLKTTQSRAVAQFRLNQKRGNMS